MAGKPMYPSFRELVLLGEERQRNNRALEVGGVLRQVSQYICCGKLYDTH